MPEYNRKVKSDNEHLALVSGGDTRWLHISGAGTTTVKTGGGVLRSVLIGTGAATAIVVRNGSEVISTIAASATGNYPFNLYFNGNLIVETVSGHDVTVTFR